MRSQHGSGCHGHALCHGGRKGGRGGAEPKRPSCSHSVRDVSFEGGEGGRKDYVYCFAEKPRRKTNQTLAIALRREARRSRCDHRRDPLLLFAAPLRFPFSWKQLGLCDAETRVKAFEIQGYNGRSGGEGC